MLQAPHLQARTPQYLADGDGGLALLKSHDAVGLDPIHLQEAGILLGKLAHIGEQTTAERRGRRQRLDQA